MKKTEPYRFISAVKIVSTTDLLGDAANQRNRMGEQHITYLIAGKPQGLTECAKTDQQIIDAAKPAEDSGYRWATSTHMNRDADRPVCAKCMERYKSRPSSQYGQWVKAMK